MGSVAESVDLDNLVIFDKTESCFIPGHTPEAASIRRAIAKAVKKTTIRRRKNTFYLPLWVQPPKGETPDRPFHRQGPTA